MQDIREMDLQVKSLWSQQINGLLPETPSEDGADSAEGGEHASFRKKARDLTLFLFQRYCIRL